MEKSKSSEKPSNILHERQQHLMTSMLTIARIKIHPQLIDIKSFGNQNVQVL